MKLHHFALFTLWHYAFVDSKKENPECCSNNSIIVDYKCQNENTNKSVLQCDIGMFHIELDDSLKEDDIYFLVSGKYCIGDSKTIVYNKSDTYEIKMRYIVACIPADEFNSLSIISSPLLLILSIGGLILTLVVYIIVPDLRDLQGLCTMCLCGSLALGYLHILLIQLITVRVPAWCYIMGFSMYYWLLAAFFWMNVISVDMVKNVTFKNRNIPDKRMFLYYTLYGWGIPLAFLVITLSANFIEGSHIKPHIGTDSCWFYGEIETWAYFYGPVTVLLIANVILFGVTFKTLWYTTNYNNVTKLKSIKYKFCLYIKLLLVNGFIWLIEFISFVYDAENTAWIVVDILCMLSGLLYFLILVVFRKRARKGLAKLGLRIPCVSYNNEMEEEEIMEEENQP